MELTRPLIVFDLETTGTWIDKDRIIEIALLKYMPSGEQEQYVKRVNPGISIPQHVVRLTGISDQDVQDAPAFKTIAAEVFDFIGDADFGGFNLERFDLPVLEREFSNAGIQFYWRDRAVYDAQKIYHLEEKRDLKAAYKFYCGKDLENAHSALCDAQATFEVLQQQLKQYGKEDDSIEFLRTYEYRVSDEYFGKDKKFRWWNKKLYPMFGKYARKYSIDKIAQIDSDYLAWMLRKDFSDEIKAMIEGVFQGKMPMREENIEGGH